jgi:hypothetical protein
MNSDAMLGIVAVLCALIIVGGTVWRRGGSPARLAAQALTWGAIIGIAWLAATLILSHRR